jgi:Ser/Thr protein kinase RdoA (MazF antagonist)
MLHLVLVAAALRGSVFQHSNTPVSALRDAKLLRSAHAARAAPTMAVATLVDEKLVGEALKSLLGSDEGCTVTPTSGGVNNMVQFVDTPSGERLVLRIYNNGGNTPRVRYEHAILDALPQHGPFSFQLPTYRRAPDGSSSVLLSNGASACISQLIPGGLPKTADPEPIGRATGELLMALGKIELPADVDCPTPPYFDVYNVHKAIAGDKDRFYAYVAGSELDGCRDAINRLIAQFRVLDARLDAMVAQKLPMQLIHGDLHYDNVLFDTSSGAVSGLLDFEFAAVDWRAMELAVCLSKYVGEKDPFPLCRSFIDGFAESGRLTRQECEGLPEMINLRVMSNVIYFVGRAISGEDTIDSLTTRAEMYATRMEWVSANRQRIIDCIAELMSEKDPAF